MAPRWASWTAFAALALLCEPIAFSQQNFGRFTGVVKDPSGSVIVGANVTARHELTTVEATTTTNSDGAYTFVSLPVGSYTISAGFTGFRTMKREDIRLVAGQTLTLDFDL